jgi:hypothetical protein
MKSLVWKAEGSQGYNDIFIIQKDSKQSGMVPSEFGKVLLILGIFIFIFLFLFCFSFLFCQDNVFFFSSQVFYKCKRQNLMTDSDT